MDIIRPGIYPAGEKNPMKAKTIKVVLPKADVFKGNRCRYENFAESASGLIA